MKFEDINQKEELLQAIKKHEWKLYLKEYPYMIRVKKKFDFSGSIVKMNIYWNGKGKITRISTHMDHPTKGKGQMFRVVSGVPDLVKYLINPREHSKSGYGRSKKQKKQ